MALWGSVGFDLVTMGVRTSQKMSSKWASIRASKAIFWCFGLKFKCTQNGHPFFCMSPSWTPV